MQTARLLVLVGLISAALTGQTFRGGLAGSVADASGAAVPEAPSSNRVRS